MLNYVVITEARVQLVLIEMLNYDTVPDPHSILLKELVNVSDGTYI